MDGVPNILEWVGVPELMLLYNDLPPHSSTPPLPVAQSDSMIFYVNITTYGSFKLQPCVYDYKYDYKCRFSLCSKLSLVKKKQNVNIVGP